MGSSLSFDFGDYVTTFRRLSSDYRLSGLSTFGRLSDYRATIDFATISDFGDFWTVGGDPCRSWVWCARGDIPRLYIWGCFSGPVTAVPSRTRCGWTVRRCAIAFLPFLVRSDGVLTSGHTVDRVSCSVRCASCTRKIRGVRFCLPVPELLQIVRDDLYSPQDARKRWQRVSVQLGQGKAAMRRKSGRMTA